MPRVWEPRLLALVDAFGIGQADAGILLAHHRIPDLRRDRIPKRELARRGITVCIDDQLPDHVSGSVDPLVARGRRLYRAVVRIHPRMDPYEDPLCHELLHALTAIADTPHERPFPYENSSCVCGYLTEPGPFDQRFIRWVYRKAALRRKSTSTSESLSESVCEVTAMATGAGA